MIAMKKFVLLTALIISGLLIKAQVLPGIHFSSWIGNTFGGKQSSFGYFNASDPTDKWVQNFIDCMTVEEDGTCYTTSGWDEAGRRYGIYKDGDVLGNENRTIVCGSAGGFLISGTTITGNGYTITDAGMPTALAMGRGIYAGKLLVADNGQRKQILIYDVSSTPVIIETLGVAGGIATNFTAAYDLPAAINAPAYPANNYPPGKYHPLKLWGLTGVGCDLLGRIFVATSEQGSGIRCFKKVNNNWILDWRVESYFFVDNIAYDEASDAVDIYGVQEHFKLDFSKTEAGKEWSIAGYTLDAYNYPEDPRGIGEIKSGGEHMLTSVETRVINGTRYLWTHGMTCQPPVIFKFKPNSDIAVPCGMFFGRTHRIYNLPITYPWPPNRPSTNVDETLFWSDLNNDGKYQANEYNSLQHVFDDADFYIEKSGALWQGINPIKIWKPTFEVNGNLVYNSANVEEVTINGVDKIGKLKFQEEYDRLVILTTACRNIDGGKMYTIDNWSTGNRTAKYVGDLKGPHQSAWTVAGDYAFEAGWETRATVWVTDLRTGQLVGTMIPDASCGGLNRTGWVDISSGIKAYKRTSTGEYVVFVEDDGLGRVLMYRWCPEGNCLNGGAATGVQINPTAKNVKAGDSTKLSLIFIPINASNQNATWSSNNTAVATVDQKGMVKAISPGVAEISAVTADGGFTVKSLITVILFFPVSRANAPLLIDGKLDEDGWLATNLINKPTGGVQNNEGRFNLLWDETYLYVGTIVKDAIVNSFPANNPWDNDAVEFYIDANKNKAAAYDDFDIQVIQSIGSSNVWTSRTTSGIISATHIITGGYSMEMAIPWTVLNKTAVAGFTMGFDISYDDNDNVTRDGSTTWHGTGENYANTSQFDDLILLAAVIPPPSTWKIGDNLDPGFSWTNYTQDACGTCYKGTAHYTNIMGSTAEYTFTGTEVEAYCETFSGFGSVNIFIDGVLKGTYSQDVAPFGGANKFATIAGLSDGVHIIKFVAAGAGWTGIDYIRFRTMSVLPLQLISFTAKLENGKARLKWKTENEINVSHFDIERSSDGNRFDKIKEIASGGNGNYNTLDVAPQKGYNYYRLKMVDKDGRFSYSNVEMVKSLNDAIFSFIMYPNPNNGLLVVEPSQSNKPVIVSIFDQQGRLLLVKQITGKTPIAIHHLAKGIYTVKLINQGDVKTGKLVKE